MSRISTLTGGTVDVSWPGDVVGVEMVGVVGDADALVGAGGPAGSGEPAQLASVAAMAVIVAAATGVAVRARTLRMPPPAGVRPVVLRSITLMGHHTRPIVPTGAAAGVKTSTGGLRPCVGSRSSPAPGCHLVWARSQSGGALGRLCGKPHLGAARLLGVTWCGRGARVEVLSAAYAVNRISEQPRPLGVTWCGRGARVEVLSAAYALNRISEQPRPLYVTWRGRGARVQVLGRLCPAPHLEAPHDPRRRLQTGERRGSSSTTAQPAPRSPAPWGGGGRWSSSRTTYRTFLGPTHSGRGPGPALAPPNGPRRRRRCVGVWGRGPLRRGVGQRGAASRCGAEGCCLGVWGRGLLRRGVAQGGVASKCGARHRDPTLPFDSPGRACGAARVGLRWLWGRPGGAALDVGPPGWGCAGCGAARVEVRLAWGWRCRDVGQG